MRKVPITPTKQNMLTAGKVLNARRQELGLSLTQASLDTKIQRKYLSLIEEDKYSSFDSPVFVNGFIKIYADYLGLNVDKIIAIYRRSIKEQGEKEAKFKNQRPDLMQYVTPKGAAYTLLASAVLFFVIYFSYQFYQFQKEPLLTIEEPEQLHFTTEQSEINLKGQTESDTTIEINGEPTSIDDDNRFSISIKLSEGSNTISVKAIKNQNKGSQTVKILNINYKPEAEQSTEEIMPEPIQPTEQILLLEILNSETWVQMNVDDRQELAEILPPGFTQQFTITESFNIISGKPLNIKISVNGEPFPLNIRTETGVGSLVCELKDNKISCD